MFALFFHAIRTINFNLMVNRISLHALQEETKFQIHLQSLRCREEDASKNIQIGATIFI
jgi:hypothetical protein